MLDRQTMHSSQRVVSPEAASPTHRRPRRRGQLQPAARGLHRRPALGKKKAKCVAPTSEVFLFQDHALVALKVLQNTLLPRSTILHIAPPLNKSGSKIMQLGSYVYEK
jgi:hypothetical protein